MKIRGSVIAEQGARLTLVAMLLGSGEKWRRSPCNQWLEPRNRQR